MKIIEHHRIPLGPQITLLYQRHDSARAPLSVDCSFRLGYADGAPGQVYALMKAFQGQYAPAWRPRLVLTPDWSQLCFEASPEYRRQLDEQWLQLFELEAALTDLEPLKNGLRQEQQLVQDAADRALALSFQRLAFAGTAYDRRPLGQREDLEKLGQEELLDAYLHLFSRTQVYLRLRDSLPLPQVLDRIRPLLGRQRSDLHKSEPWAQELNGPRENVIHLRAEGAWIDLGFVLPGMDQSSWIHGPLLKAWLKDVWQAEPPSPHLQLLDLDWLAWQKASLLVFRMHTAQVAEMPEHKLKLLQWLAQARQGYLTSRRLKAAVQQATAAWSEENPPLWVRIDEMLDGWGHGRQRLNAIGLTSFQQAFGRWLNADHWVLQEAYSPLVNVRSQPDHRKEMAQLGFAPRPKPVVQIPRLQEIQRLHLGSFSLWMMPQPGWSQLELGVWFASGSAGESVSGTTALLMELLGQRFAALWHQLEEKGAIRTAQSWQTGVSRDSCFFRWAVGWSELPQAIQLLHGLLQELPLDSAAFQSLKQTWQARLQRSQLDPAWRAIEQFTVSGFANHPYAWGVNGSYASLQKIGPDVVRQRWRELRQSAMVHPLVLGHIPANLSAEQLAPAFESLLESASPGPLPEPRIRRGEIQATADPRGYRLEGQLFNHALPLDQHAILKVGLQWLENQMRSEYGIPISSHCELMKQAWYFAFAGLYTKPERQEWLSSSIHVYDSLDLLKQRMIAELRGRALNPASCWPDLVHWLSLGGTPGAFADREHQLLTLHREDVEAFISQVLTKDNEWLQVVFQGLEDRVAMRRY